MEEMVTVTLNWSYGYGRPVKYYGPGENIPVPIGLARTLGIPVPEPEQDPEPEAPPKPYAPLPDDFPGKELLEAAGFTDPGGISAMSSTELTAIEGIGRATARRIMDAAQELTGETATA